jgi:hypothetical protein
MDTLLEAVLVGAGAGLVALFVGVVALSIGDRDMMWRSHAGGRVGGEGAG